MPRIMNRMGWSISGAVALALVAALAGVIYAGPMDPPRAPGPTQSNLIYQPSSCAGFPIVLSAPGAYDLAENITGCSGKDGVDINSNEVSLDLKGFLLNGINVGTNAINVGGAGGGSIRNGSIVSWSTSGVQGLGFNETLEDVSINVSGGTGISGAGDNMNIRHCEVSGAGITLNGGSAVIDDCQVTGNTINGISISGGTHAVMTHVSTKNNASDGIFVFNADVQISDCISNGNGYSGIVVVTGSSLSVQGCEAASNGADGFSFVNATGAASGNNVHDNTADGIAASGGSVRVDGNNTAFNGGNGITADMQDQVTNNNASRNHTNGIWVWGDDTTVANNTTSDNDQYGIKSTGNRERISDNHASGNHITLGCADIWITGAGSGSVVENNSAENTAGCGLIWFDAPKIIAHGNISRGGGGYNTTGLCVLCDIGPIGTVAASTSPWANISD